MLFSPAFLGWRRLVLNNDYLPHLFLPFPFPLHQMASSASHNFCGLQFWSLLNETHAGFGNHNVIYNLPLNTFIQLVAHGRKRTPYELTVKGLIWLFPHENPGRGACKRGWEKKGRKQGLATADFDNQWEWISDTAWQGSHPITPGHSSRKGKSGQVIMNAEWPVSTGLAYAIALRVDKHSDKIQKLHFKCGKFD